MIYLACPYCKETTEHKILTLTNDKIEVLCTECVFIWKGKIIWQGDKKE